MKEVTDLYNKEYCSKISCKKWRAKEVPVIVDVLYDHFRPTSVIDIGCSNGLHLKEFRKRGIVCFGIEGTPYFKEYITGNFGSSFIIHDIRKPLKVDAHFHLALCVEVLEHLEEEFADVAVKNIGETAEVLCITASPKKTANYHINAQEKEYWVGKFTKDGEFEYKDEETAALQTKFSLHSLRSNWMTENLMIFRRKE